MDELEVRTVVYAPAEEVYDLLLDFQRYSRYSDHLRSVRRLAGDGGADTSYALTFAWWKLTYTARSAVTDVDPPNRIDWRITKDINARGAWWIRPLEGSGTTPDVTTEAPDAMTEAPDAMTEASDAMTEASDDSDREPDACEVVFEVAFDPDTASSDALDLPRLVSFDWVLGKVVPLVKREAETVVRRAVVDLEGRERDVDLDVRVDSERI